MERSINDESRDLMKLIQMRFPRLSKGQKLIAEYILKNYDKINKHKISISIYIINNIIIEIQNYY